MDFFAYYCLKFCCVCEFYLFVIRLVDDGWYLHRCPSLCNWWIDFLLSPQMFWHSVLLFVVWVWDFGLKVMWFSYFKFPQVLVIVLIQGFLLVWPIVHFVVLQFLPWFYLFICSLLFKLVGLVYVSLSSSICLSSCFNYGFDSMW